MANSESTAQPIICCLGQSVAGQPTQFLLERAFESTRLPWQALSIEVREEKLPLICEAMQEMSFRGIRFYGQLEKRACEYLTTPSTLEQYIGSVTSAINQHGRWQAWDNRGWAWLELFKQYGVESLWLHGNSIACRSLWAAMLARGGGKLKWIWTDAPAELTDLDWMAQYREQVSDRIFTSAGPLPSIEKLATLLGCGLVDSDRNTAISQSEPNSPTYASPEDSGPSPILMAIVTDQERLPHSDSDLLESLNIELLIPSDLKLLELVGKPKRAVVSPADLAVAAEAYDFYRWTNKRIESSVLRDAYDEFCDF